MSAEDRHRWDGRYATHGPASTESVCLPAVFTPFVEAFPTTGHALDLACGSGSASVWFARRGLDAWGLDVSPVAIARACELAFVSGVAGRCRFDVADLDDGLPSGPPADVVLCHMFRDARLDPLVLDRLTPGGLLAISALSEVGASRGRFRIRPGGLREAFGELDVIAEDEADGQAWLLARG